MTTGHPIWVPRLSTGPNQIVRSIQAQRSNDCNQEIWNPAAKIKDYTPPGSAAIAASDFTAPCADNSATVDPEVIGNTDTPLTLANLAEARFGNDTYGGFASDAEGNILVEFDTANRPTDGSQCWLFVAKANYWDQKS